MKHFIQNLVPTQNPDKEHTADPDSLTMSHSLLRLKLTGAFFGGAVSCYLGQEMGTLSSPDHVRCWLDKINSKLRKVVKIEKGRIPIYSVTFTK